MAQRASGKYNAICEIATISRYFLTQMRRHTPETRTTHLPLGQVGRSIMQATGKLRLGLFFFCGGLFCGRCFSSGFSHNFFNYLGYGCGSLLYGFCHFSYSCGSGFYYAGDFNHRRYGCFRFSTEAFGVHLCDFSSNSIAAGRYGRFFRINPFLPFHVGLLLCEGAFLYAAHQVLAVEYAFEAEDGANGIGGLSTFDEPLVSFFAVNLDGGGLGHWVVSTQFGDKAAIAW